MLLEIDDGGFAKITKVTTELKRASATSAVAKKSKNGLHQTLCCHQIQRPGPLETAKLDIR